MGLLIRTAKYWNKLGDKLADRRKTEGAANKIAINLSDDGNLQLLLDDEKVAEVPVRSTPDVSWVIENYVETIIQRHLAKPGILTRENQDEFCLDYKKQLIAAFQKTLPPPSPTSSPRERQALLQDYTLLGTRRFDCVPNHECAPETVRIGLFDRFMGQLKEALDGYKNPEIRNPQGEIIEGLPMFHPDSYTLLDGKNELNLYLLDMRGKAQRYQIKVDLPESGEAREQFLLQLKHFLAGYTLTEQLPCIARESAMNATDFPKDENMPEDEDKFIAAMKASGNFGRPQSSVTGKKESHGAAKETDGKTPD